jgi:hypothetical protein
LSQPAERSILKICQKPIPFQEATKLPHNPFISQLPQSLAILVSTIPIGIQEISAIYNNNLIQQEDGDERENGEKSEGLRCG